MDIVNRAIILAVKAHSGAVRKETKLPYIVHPIESCAIAASITDDKEIIAAAVLHDVVEDTDITKEELVKEFGERVTNLVCSDTEDKMRDIPAEKSWKLRKQATLDFLDKATKEEQIICLADKLSNMRAIYRDYNRLGDKLWERFNQKDKNEHAWYYGGIAERLTCLKEIEAYKEYKDLLDKIFTRYYLRPSSKSQIVNKLYKTDGLGYLWVTDRDGNWHDNTIYNDYEGLYDGPIMEFVSKDVKEIIEITREEAEELIKELRTK